MGEFKWCLLAMVATACWHFANSQALGKEAFLSVPKLITSKGYPVERHRAHTEDGYSLQMHRIPAGRRSARKTSQKGKSAVLLVHGLFGSSSDFVIMGPKRSLGYLLADSGYDVWLGNLRGTTYSSHQNMSKEDPKFWEFSIHEHGTYDVPAMIDMVLNATGLPKLLYIGYSMGTTSFFVTMSERPQYNEKVISFVALAPAVFLDNVKPLAEMLLVNVNAPDTLRTRGVQALSLRRDLAAMVVGALCRARRPTDDICLRLVYAFVGEDYEQNDWEMSPIILARSQPASLRQLEHFGKISITSKFIKYGDGMADKTTQYDLNSTRVPVTLIYGDNDQLTVKSQVMRLAKMLNSTGMLITAKSVSWPKFNHLDFVFAKDVDSLLNKDVLQHVKRLFKEYGNA